MNVLAFTGALLQQMVCQVHEEQLEPICTMMSLGWNARGNGLLRRNRLCPLRHRRVPARSVCAAAAAVTVRNIGGIGALNMHSACNTAAVLFIHGVC